MTTAPEMTWPETEDEATADRLIVAGARRAIQLDTLNDELYRDVPWDNPKDDPERRSAILRYVDGISATVTAAQNVALLIELQKRSREDADVAAQLLWQMTDDGAWLIESLWDHLTERGIDADAVWREETEAANKRAQDRS